MTTALSPLSTRLIRTICIMRETRSAAIIASSRVYACVGTALRGWASPRAARVASGPIARRSAADLARRRADQVERDVEWLAWYGINHLRIVHGRGDDHVVSHAAQRAQGGELQLG